MQPRGHHEQHSPADPSSECLGTILERLLPLCDCETTAFIAISPPQLGARTWILQCDHGASEASLVPDWVSGGATIRYLANLHRVFRCCCVAGQGVA